MRYSKINLDNKSILITGGAGFIGSNLALHFQKNYSKTKIVVVDKFRSDETFSNGNLKSFGHFKNLIEFKGEVISGDINDKTLMQKIENSYNFDYIFHQAAISDTTIQDQQQMIKTNVNAYKTLLEIAIKHKANMIYASSAATYGNALSPQTIGCEAPQNVYGFSKLMMDNITFEYIKKDLDIHIVGLRYFNVYGKNEFFKNKTASMILQFGDQILNGNAPKLFENSNKIFRDFIYIEDVINANIKAMNPKKSGVYNVGTGKARSFEDITNILQTLLETNHNYIYIPNPFVGQYQFHTQANMQSSLDNLNFSANYTLEDGIKAYLPEIKRINSQKSEVV